MATASNLPVAHRDRRFPMMPASRDLLGQFTKPRPSPRERNRPRNGPSINEWESALIGRQLIKEDAATPLSPDEPLSPLPAWSVRDQLIFCVQHAESALSRVPVPIVLEIERILHDAVGDLHALFRILLRAVMER